MNKGNIAVIIAIIAALVIGGGVLVTRNRTQPTGLAPTVGKIEIGQKEKIGIGTQQSVFQGRYLTYSQQAFDQAKDKKRVYYFHASWCPICRPLDQEFTRRQNEIPEDLVVFKTDYDVSTELKKKYGVTYQHTFVQVDGQGNEVAKWNGGGFEELKENIRN